MKIKHILALLAVLVVALSLVACGENGVSQSEARGQIEMLLERVEEGNFESAKELLHPKRSTDIEEFFNIVEEEENVDFQSGIEIKRYTGFSSSLYHSEVDGGRFELDLDIIVSGKEFELSVEVVRNHSGFGIYDIEIDD